MSVLAAKHCLIMSLQNNEFPNNRDHICLWTPPGGQIPIFNPPPGVIIYKETPTVKFVSKYGYLTPPWWSYRKIHPNILGHFRSNYGHLTPCGHQIEICYKTLLKMPWCGFYASSNVLNLGVNTNFINQFWSK